MIEHTFRCMECGRRFRTVRAAERAANEGCPKCGGVDIDIDTDDKPQAVKDEEE
jgi:predicted  nucleic acid-binding Zn-ribbon protein